MTYVCSSSVVVTAYDSESGRPGSNPEWGLIYNETSINAHGLPEPSSLQGNTLGTRTAKHKGYNWDMHIDRWLQPCPVFGHSFSGISCHMLQKWSQFNCMTLSKSSYIYYLLHYITLHHITLHYITLHYITLHYITLHYITLHYITLHYITLHYITLHYITLHHITSHHITSHHITSHHITLHHITLHYITLHYITLHYITLHYIAWVSE